MTPPTTSSRISAGRWRFLPGVATTALLMVVVLVASASSDSPPSQTGATDVTPETTVVASTTTANTGVAVTSAAVSATGNATGLLLEAIAAVGTRYEFDTSVSLTGGTLTLVAGRIYDDSSAYSITTVGSELEYVITPDGRWVREPGDQWVALQDAAPLVDPLSMLAEPTSIEILAADNATVALAATYSGESLGFSNANQVTIEMVVTGSRLTSLRYEAAAGPDTATVETEISTTLDIEPVAVPVSAD